MEELVAQYLFEGGRGAGHGVNLYTCKRCGTKIYARSRLDAHQEHGECPDRNYVKQD